MVAILVAAFLVSRSCGATVTRVSEEQAIATAKAQIDYTPNNVMVRLIKRGFRSEPFWAVSLSQKQADGSLRNVTVVVVDAESGEVTEVRKS